MKKDFTDEKADIALRLYDILDLKNNYFLLCELDEDVEKQEKILALGPEIEMYFKAHDMSFLRLKCHKKRPYMSIIRGVFKHCKYTVLVQTMAIKKDSKTIKSQKYDIFKPGELLL